MGNKCSFCKVKKPTNHLIITHPHIIGINWIEFCEPCGIKNTLQRQTDDGIEIKSIREVFDMPKEERNGS